MDTLNPVDLLCELIAIPSFSRDEGATADRIAAWLDGQGVAHERHGNNVVAWHRSTRPDAPIVLLNSHHDTVRPASGWTHDPYLPVVADGRITGLGSNDAGGALVTMLMTFLHLCRRADLPWTICFAATAEEEVSGTDGMALLARTVFAREPLALALVGEPTGMNMAIAEKGLLVLDCTAHGRTGHAARNEGLNAITEALADLRWFHDYRFERLSPQLGPVHMTVTQIEAGNQHNVVPDRCRFVVDVRVTDVYTNEEVLDTVRAHVRATVEPRSMRLRPSAIAPSHPIVRVGKAMGLTAYGSPTMSDQSLLPENVPSLKIGPGDSARSHTPDEYLVVDELLDGIRTMTLLMERFLEEQV